MSTPGRYIDLLKVEVTGLIEQPLNQHDAVSIVLLVENPIEKSLFQAVIDGRVCFSFTFLANLLV